MSRQSWVQINGKLVPKEEAHLHEQGGRLQIMPDIESFVSPITGEVIRGRSHLRRHMREHGVTNAADYSPDWYARKTRERVQRAQGQTPEQKRERIEALKQALTQSRR